MRSICLLFFLILSASKNTNAITRFDSSQLSFKLNQQGLEEIPCQHKPLETGTSAPPPPWWTVQCEKNIYTVDIWLDEYVSAGPLYTYFLLFHAKESTSSSGEKLTRFNTQTTQFKFADRSHLQWIQSSIDVRNGLADLSVDIKINK